MSDTVKFNPPENHYIQLDIQFATRYGVNEALLFAKLFRVEKEWHGFKDKQGIKWVRLTYDEWLKETPFFSRNTIIRTLDSLVEQGLIFAMVFNGRSKWYRCNHDYVNLSTQSGYIEPDYVDATTQNERVQLPKMGTSSTQNGLLPNSLPNSTDSIIITPPENLKIINTESEAEAALRALTTNYEDCISVNISPLLADEFKDYSWQVKPEWIVNAYKATVSANVQSWNYPRKILDECIKAGRWSEKQRSNTNGHKQSKPRINGNQKAQPEGERSGGSADRARAIAQRSR